MAFSDLKNSKKRESYRPISVLEMIILKKSLTTGGRRGCKCLFSCCLYLWERYLMLIKGAPKRFPVHVDLKLSKKSYAFWQIFYQKSFKNIERKFFFFFSYAN